MTSISRSGEPTWSTVTSSNKPPPWSTSVKWEKADMLKPETYKPLLKGADAVIHSMGILLEADYKGVLTGKESIRSGLARAFSATKGGSQNPMERKEGEELRPQEKDGQFTYELMNRDTGELRGCEVEIFLCTILTTSYQPSHWPRKQTTSMCQPSSSYRLQRARRSYHNDISPLREMQNRRSPPRCLSCGASSCDQASSMTRPVSLRFR